MEKLSSDIIGNLTIDEFLSELSNKQLEDLQILIEQQRIFRKGLEEMNLKQLHELYWEYINNSNQIAADLVLKFVIKERK